MTVLLTGVAQGQQEGFRLQGYFRSVFGAAGTGDPAEAFRAPNAGAKYRLGNETEAYLELETGFDHTSRSDGVSGSLTKVTLAPQITPGVEALSRPSLRAFVTYARWSDDFVGLVAPVLYGNESRGFAGGVQIETWW